MLRPCPACRRHISAVVKTCVFCGEHVGEGVVREPIGHIGRASRAMIFAGAIAVAPIGCGPRVEYETIQAPGGAVMTTGQVKGRVVKHDGTAAAMYWVSLHGEALRALTNGADSMSVQADANGSFMFADVPPGEYHVTTNGTGQRPRIEVRAGEAAIVTLELDKPPKVDPRQMAKPYGAPPARRRVV